MVRAPVWCWIMPVRKRWSNSGPVDLARVSICWGVSMPGIIMGVEDVEDMSMPGMLPMSESRERGLPRSWSHCFMKRISSDWEMLMRWPRASTSLLWLREAIMAVMVTAWEWCMIMPCMKAMSGWEGGWGWGTAVAGVRVRVSWPGAPGWTIATGGADCWQGATAAVTESRAAARSRG